MDSPNTHSKGIGWILWIVGFPSGHRFYYGKPITGIIWHLTFGLLLIGWIIDLFLIPGMDKKADRQFTPGKVNYNVAWILLLAAYGLGGIIGLHRFYMGKWLTGLLFLFTGGLFLVGFFYDVCTLNRQIDEVNSAA